MDKTCYCDSCEMDAYPCEGESEVFDILERFPWNSLRKLAEF